MNKLDSATRTLLRDPTKRRAWIKYQIQMTGVSMATVAAQAKPPIDRRTLYTAFIRPYPRAEKILAEALGLTAQDLFPERYDSDGLPNRKMGRPPVLQNRKKCSVNTAKNTTRKTARNTQKSEAA